MNIRNTSLVITFFISLLAFSQDENKVGPSNFGTSEPMYEVPSLASRAGELILYTDNDEVIRDGKATPPDIVAGKGSVGEDLLANNPG